MGSGLQLAGSGKRLLTGECSCQSDQHVPGLGSRREHGQWKGWFSWSRRKKGNEAGEVGGARPEGAELGASAHGNHMSPNFPFSKLEEKSHIQFPYMSSAFCPSWGVVISYPFLCSFPALFTPQCHCLPWHLYPNPVWPP